MAGIALLSDLLKRSPSGFSSKALFPNGILSATVAASVAGVAASRTLLGDGGNSVAYCDAGVAWKDDYIPDLRDTPEKIFRHDSFTYSTKEYTIELKPLFSAFGLKSFAITSLRSFLMFYLPLLEPRPPYDEEEDFLQDSEETVDLVVPFKKSVKQIVREVTVITTRRLLERLAVHYVSRRLAWKLLKDVPRSAKRKAARGFSTPYFVFSVSRTTFRGHMLGIAATWLVQIGIEVYHCLFKKSDDEGDEELDAAEKFHLLEKKLCGATLRCCASLVFASAGAGICALFHPSIGQWIGCAIGDFAGPLIVTVLFEHFLQLEL